MERLRLAETSMKRARDDPFGEFDPIEDPNSAEEWKLKVVGWL